jgi:hypothetical protein
MIFNDPLSDGIPRLQGRRVLFSFNPNSFDLFDLPIRYSYLISFFGDTVPKVFHKLYPFSATQLKKRCEFNVHRETIPLKDGDSKLISNVRTIILRLERYFCKKLLN